MACLSCGGEQTAWLNMPLDAKKNSPTPFGAVVRCGSCGLGVVKDLPTTSEVSAFYELDQYYTHGQSHMPDAPLTLKDRFLIKAAWLTDFQNPLDTTTVGALLPRDALICDIGCGSCEILLRFKKMGFEVLGIDPDEGARRNAASLGISVLEGSAESIPAAATARKFDLVVMSHSLEHCLDPVAAVRNVFSLLKPGGLFYCEVPNCACEHFRTFTIASEMFDLPRHLYFFTPESLHFMLANAGFIEPEWHFFGYVRQHLPGWRLWESMIHDRVKRVAPDTPVKRHTFLSSVALLARTAFAKKTAKYDSVGLLVRRPTSSG